MGNLLNFPHLYAIDCTNIPKPKARTSSERTLLHGAGWSKYSHVSVAGWRMQTLVRLTGIQSSWVLPVNNIILKPFENINAVALNQINSLVNTVKLKPGEKITILLDAGYQATRLTYDIRKLKLPVRIIVRLSNSQVFYQNPSKQPLEHWKTMLPTAGRKGRRKIHGSKLSLKTPELPADSYVKGPVHWFGNTTVQSWSRMHAKTTGDLRKHVDGSVVEGQVVSIHTQTMGRRKRTGKVHLWISDNTDVSVLGLFQILYTYLQRYSIEHLYRFMKHWFGLTSYKAKDKESYANWVDLQLVAYSQLVVAKGTLEPRRLPWESHKRWLTTPLKIWRAFKTSLRLLWTPPVVVKKPCSGTRQTPW